METHRTVTAGPGGPIRVPGMTEWDDSMGDLCRHHYTARSRPVDPRRAAAVWTERELLQGEKADAGAVVLRTAPCSWALGGGGCTMCGYSTESVEDEVEQGLLLYQFKSAMDRLSSKEGPGEGPPGVLKIYTSGSFFDDREIPAGLRKTVMEEARARGIRRVLVETRPEHVDLSKLADMMGQERGGGEGAPQLEVAFGLESASDPVRARLIHKGFPFADFQRAVGVCKDAGAFVRTYLLMKPPFLGEGAAMEDMMSSVERLRGLTGTISINPVNVQKGTLVETMWRGGWYRPPWLWSLVEVLRRNPWSPPAKDDGPPERGGQADGVSEAAAPRLVSSPSGGGQARGVHNCGRCDGDVLRAVESFSLTGDPDAFRGLDCPCKDRWRMAVDPGAQAFQPGAVDVSHGVYRWL